MKRCAVSTAKSALGGVFANRKKNRQIITLALTLVLCGVFYSLNFKNADISGFAQAKDKKVATKKDFADPCDEDLPKASISDPNLGVYKIENLCKKIEIENGVVQFEKPEDPETAAFRAELEEILDETPMEKMIDAIVEQDKKVAAFLVGIAFKESKFGVYSPVDSSGKHCYNYWGFKGKTNPQRSGYSCFSSPEEAVAIVGKRLDRLVLENKLDTPNKMTVWKCGSSCATHSPQSVAKWISDVSIHFYPLSKS